MKRPLVLLCTSVLLGHVIVRVLPLGPSRLVVAVILSVGVGAGGVFLLARFVRRHHSPVALALAAGLLAAAGALTGARADAPPWPYAPRAGVDRPVLLRVDATPVPRRGDDTSFRTDGTLTLGGEAGFPAGGRIIVITETKRSWRPGDHLLLRGSPVPLREHLNPVGPPSRWAALRSAGFVARLWLSRADEAIRVPAELAAPARDGVWGRYSFSQVVELVRARIACTLEDPDLGEGGALMRALVLGDRGGLRPQTVEAFAQTGTAHLLAVSGLHVGIVAVVVLMLLTLASRLLARIRLAVRGVGSLLCVPICACYVAIAGAPVSAVRSLWMVALVAIALALRRPPDGWSILMVAAAGVALVVPSAPGSAAYDLSFAAVAGILLLVPPLRREAARRFGRIASWLDAGAPGRALRWLLHAVAATIAATAATAPFVAYHFGRLPGLGTVANVVAIPLLTFVVLPAALVTGVLAATWPSAAALLAPVGAELAGTLLWVVRLAAGAPGAQSWGQRIPLAVALVFELALVILATGFREHASLPQRRTCTAMAAVTAAGGALAATLVLFQPGVGSRAILRVTFLDVGQADATLVELPDGARLLVDAGNDPRARRVVNAIRHVGSRLDHLVVTHGHPDHAAGAAAVLATTPPRSSILHNGSEASTSYVGAMRGPRPPWRHGPARVDWLWPPAAADEAHAPTRTENDASVVLRIRIGRRTLLLAGDIEAETENALVGGPVPLDADVVKVPHHGSGTSSTGVFLRATRPLHAIVSCGWANRWGFPAPAVVAGWKALDAELWRTSRDGAVVVETDGEWLRVSAARR